MNHKPIGSRGHLFTFDRLKPMLTHVYTIQTPHYLFVIDTFLGQDAMKSLLETLGPASSLPQIVVINTHFHWDHIWGNGYFRNAPIIAHSSCRALIAEHGNSETLAYGHFAMGVFDIIPPNLTFDSHMAFPDDGIELIHTPGHSEDSISIIDHVDDVLIAGDNIEAPIPYLSSRDIAQFASTLRSYQSHQWKAIVAGHAVDFDGTLLSGNIAYLDALATGNDGKYLEAPYKAIHEINRAVLDHTDHDQSS